MAQTSARRSSKAAAIRQMAQQAKKGEGCARCLRPTPPVDSDTYSLWETTGDGSQLICPDCVTGDEQQTVDEDALRLAEKVRENRLRRAAERQGFKLTRSRRRDPRAIDYGGYMVIDVHTNGVVAGGHPYAYSLDLDAVESFLNDE